MDLKEVSFEKIVTKNYDSYEMCRIYLVNDKNTNEQSLVFTGNDEVLFISKDREITYGSYEHLKSEYIILKEVTNQTRIIVH